MMLQNRLFLGSMSPPVPVLSKIFERVSTSKFNVSACSMNGQRSSMEDEITILPSIRNHPQFSLFAVFDGHGGWKASEFLSKELGHAISELTPDQIQDNDAVKKVIVDLDKTFCASTGTPPGLRDSGSTIAMALVESAAEELNADSKKQKKSIFKIRVFWAGDSRVISGAFANNAFNPPPVSPGPNTDEQIIKATEDAFLQFLVREQRPRDFGSCDLKGTIPLYTETTSHTGSFNFKTLTVDHVPSVSQERARIEEAGSCVFAGRVAGCLAVSRAFGDAHYKQMVDVAFEEQPVSSVCEVSECQIELDDESDTHWLLLCCDGLVEHSSNTDVISSLHAEYHANRCRIFCSEDHMPYGLGNVLTDSIADGSMDNLSAIFVELRHFSRTEDVEENTQVVRTFLPGSNTADGIEASLAFERAALRFQQNRCGVFPWTENMKQAMLMEKLRSYTQFATCCDITKNADQISSRQNRLAVMRNSDLEKRHVDIKALLKEWENIGEEEKDITRTGTDEHGSDGGSTVVSEDNSSLPVDDAWKSVSRDVVIVASTPADAEESRSTIDDGMDECKSLKKRSLREVDDVDVKEDEPCEKKRRLDVRNEKPEESLDA